MLSEPYVRVHVQLRVVDDYPPVESETLWARPVSSEGLCVVDSIPFFAKKVSSNDLIRTSGQNPQIYFESVVRTGGHSTVRVVFFDSENAESIKRSVSELGCEYESHSAYPILSVDIPPTVDYSKFVKILKKLESQGILDFEEANIQHVIQGH